MPCAAGRGAGTPHSDRPINAKTAPWNRNHRNRRAVVMLCGLAACCRWGRRCPRRLAALAPAELRHAYPCTVHPSAGGIGKLRQALPGGFQAHSTVGGVHPGCRLGEIPFLPPAHIALSGTLHLVDLVPGVQFAIVLDVPGVQLFQLVAGPCGRVAQLREQREKGVTAVPAAQPGTPKSGCMILPEICTDNSGKIQKRR